MQPDCDNGLGELLAVNYKAEAEENPLPVVGGAWFRHSSAGSCARQIAYAMAGVEETNPPDVTSHHSFKVGHLAHEAWQDDLRASDDSAEIEAEYTIPTNPGDERALSGCHIDAVRLFNDHTEVIELKTANEYGYSDAVLKGNGPKWGHTIQASLNAKAYSLAHPDEEVVAVIVYLPMTSVSVGRAQKHGIADTNRHGAQWTIERHAGIRSPLGEIGWEAVADWELERVRWIKSEVAMNGAGSVIRWWPESMQEPGAPLKLIEDPTRRAFPCGAPTGAYCKWYDKCLEDGPGGVRR